MLNIVSFIRSNNDMRLFHILSLYNYQKLKSIIYFPIQIISIFSKRLKIEKLLIFSSLSYISIKGKTTKNSAKI
jgi:hypothetical protein